MQSWPAATGAPRRSGTGMTDTTITFNNMVDLRVNKSRILHACISNMITQLQQLNRQMSQLLRSKFQLLHSNTEIEQHEISLNNSSIKTKSP